VIVNDNQYLYSKWCFEIHRRTKEQKTEIEIAEKSFKILLQGPNFIYFTTSGITNYKITIP
jgi:hypothetical protein